MVCYRRLMPEVWISRGVDVGACVRSSCTRLASSSKTDGPCRALLVLVDIVQFLVVSFVFPLAGRLDHFLSLA